METLLEISGYVCGQQMDHTWFPAGWPLPVCQRCTGLYVGAALALALLLGFRPRLAGWFLWVHGLFLLGMAPFGLHWIKHGPVVRTLTGLLFGAAIVAFLAPWPIEVLHDLLEARRLRIAPANPGLAWPSTTSSGLHDRSRTRCYWLVLGLAAAGLPLLCQSNSPSAAGLAIVGIVAGGLSFVGLLILNALALARWLGRLARQFIHRRLGTISA
jgi:uncharacterized membrane protein